MRVLVDILHPAHVHVFRTVREELLGRGHEVSIVSREKDVTVGLLDALGIPHRTISVQGRGMQGMAGELLLRGAHLAGIARRERPDLLLGIMGLFIAPVGRLLGIPSVVLYDTENARLTNPWIYPLADRVVTPDCYAAHVPGRHVTYPGYHELAYLHPDRFTADRSVLAEAGLPPREPFSLVRFVSWEASHDIGQTIPRDNDRLAIVRELSLAGPVRITSEGPLPPDLEPFRLHLPPHRIHHLLAHASLYVGESATMASEAAVLGVPSIFVSRVGRGYTSDLERRYGLCVCVRTVRGALAAVRRLLADPDRVRTGRARRDRMLADKVDVAAWLADRLAVWYGCRGGG